MVQVNGYVVTCLVDIGTVGGYTLTVWLRRNHRTYLMQEIIILYRAFLLFCRGVMV